MAEMQRQRALTHLLLVHATGIINETAGKMIKVTVLFEKSTILILANFVNTNILAMRAISIN
ncbi:hypothetical protein EYC82_15475 [Halieaceae bacterium IMCC11814]|uniref:Uncharacterized protein n=1 Tax=Candidatus Marimicrobium litorale TaxID=2518991 RepID=A0ABT3TBB7_9GAMM|nr:hypothetical protein [Candidatus Marimicrobium litorale]